MWRVWTLVFCVAGVPAAPGAVSAETAPVALTVEGGVGFVDGSVQRELGEVDLAEVGLLNSTRYKGTWSSELELPKDTEIGIVTVTVRGDAGPRWDWATSLDLWMNATDPDTEVIQRSRMMAEVSEGIYQFDQWRYPTERYDGLVYSESSADVDMTGFNGKAMLVKRTPSGPIACVFGYRHHDLSYEVFGLEGYLEGTDVFGMPSGTMASVPSSTKVFTYDTSCRMPYVGLGYEFDVFTWLHGSMEADYSPWVAVKDRGRSLLDSLYSRSRTDGTGFALNLTLRCDLAAGVFALFRADYLSVDAEGDETELLLPALGTPRGMTYHGPVQIAEDEVRVAAGLGYRF